MMSKLKNERSWTPTAWGMILFGIACFLVGAIISSFASFSFVSSGAGDIKVNTPSGSIGRRVSLYNTTGVEERWGISGDTQAILTPPPPPTVPNNGFESCTVVNNDPSSWTVSSTTTTGCFTSIKRTGTWSFYADALGYAYQTFSLTSGIQYTFGVYARRAGGSPAQTPQLLVSTAAGGGTTRCQATTTSTSFTLLSCNYTPSINETVYLNLKASVNNASDAYFDDVSVSAGTSSGTYFFRMTSVDGYTFMDNSGWVTVTNGDTWSWTNSGLTCRSDVQNPVSANCSSSWSFEERGTSGNYYMAIKKSGTSDYVYQTYPIGGNNLTSSAMTNLALNKILFTSSIYYAMITDPSFEAATLTNWPDIPGAACSSVCSQDTTVPNFLDGVKSLKFTTPTTTIGKRQSVTVSTSTNYSLVVSFKSGLSTGQFVVDVRNSADTSTLLTLTANNNSNWEWMSGTFNSGSNTSVYIRIFSQNVSGNTGSAWADAIDMCATSTSSCDGHPKEATNGTTNTRWLTTSSTGSVTIDFGSTTTFNTVHLIQNDGEGYGMNGITVSGSADNSSFTTIKTVSRLQYDSSFWIYFADQSYRYLKINGTSSYTRPELFEVAVYRTQASNSFGDIDEIVLAINSNVYPVLNITYASKVTNGDGSVTYTKTIGGLTIDTTYKKVSDYAWKKSVKLTSDTTGRIAIRNLLARDDANIKHMIHSNGAEGFTDKDYTLDDSAYSNIYQIFMFSTVCNPQCFGVVADDGWNAKWMVVNATEPGSTIETLELAGQLAYGLSNWKNSYLQYGKDEQGKRYITITAATPLTLNFYYYFSDDPIYKESALLSYVAFMDGKGFQSLDRLDKLFAASGYQNVRIRKTTEQTTQWVIAAPGYSNGGQYNDAIPITEGLGNQGIVERALDQFRKAAAWQPITYSDTLNSTAGLDFPWQPIAFAWYAKSKFGTSIVNQEVEDQKNAILNILDANGEYISSDIADDAYLSGNPFLVGDVFIRGQMNAILNLRSAKALLPVCGTSPCWSTSNETSLSNAITALRSLYDSTNGYIHLSKYGHWRRVSDASLSGGYEMQTADYVYSQEGNTGATMRFVAPAAGTLTYYTIKGPNRGKMNISLNGSPVTGSPFDLYNSTILYQQSITSFTVAVNDVITFRPDSTKNASSTGYYAEVDKLTIGANTYEEDNSNFQCGSLLDCTAGHTLGWATWRDNAWIWHFELLYRELFNEQMFTDAQILAHFNSLSIGNLSNGSFGGFNYMSNGDYVPEGYYNPGLGGYYRLKGVYHRGGDGALFSLSAYKLLRKYLNGDTTGINYMFQESSLLASYGGSGWNESSHVYSANNRDVTSWPFDSQYVESNTTSDDVTFSFKGTSVIWYTVTGPARGRADVYIDGSLDTSNVDTYSSSTTYRVATYTKTGLTFGDHTIRVVVNGTKNASSTDYFIAIDSFKVNTHASWLEALRKDLEIAVRPISHEYICTDKDDSCYGDSHATGRRDSNGWNNFYRAGVLVNYPKDRGMRQGVYFRRP